MVKRLRYQENSRPRRRGEQREHWVLEPFDIALMAMTLIAALVLPVLIAGI